MEFTARLSVIATLLCVGCDTGSGSVADGDTDEADSSSSTSAGGSATGGMAATGNTGAGGQAGDSGAECGSYANEDGFLEVPASDPGIRYVGRLDFTDPDAPRFAFPAVSIETVFEGDAIDLMLNENAPGGATRTAYYAVSIDDEPAVNLETCAQQEVYPLARNLQAGTHRVRIAKRTEAQVGTAAFLGFRVRDGTRLRLPEAPERRLEFVGDSITCGYGNQLSTTDPASHPFTSINENALEAYGGLTARALAADFVVVAASGRGMVRNYSGGGGLTVPGFYDSTAPDASWPAWDSADYSPDAIVVNLGTNDFSIGLDADGYAAMREEFRDAYADFLTHLRELHSEATLIAAVGPMLSDSYPPDYRAWTSIRADVSAVVEARAAAGDDQVHYLEFTPQASPYGEDWHPTVATHQRMADELIALLRETEGW